MVRVPYGIMDGRSRRNSRYTYIGMLCSYEIEPEEKSEEHNVHVRYKMLWKQFICTYLLVVG